MFDQNYINDSALSFNTVIKLPQINFYRRLKQVLDLSFIPGSLQLSDEGCGELCLNQILFYKLILVGYIEGVKNDTKLIELCSRRYDILYFLGLHFEGELPLPEELSYSKVLINKKKYSSILDRIFSLCIQKNIIKI